MLAKKIYILLLKKKLKKSETERKRKKKKGWKATNTNKTQICQRFNIIVKNINLK
jgi:hypothetical protein